MKLSELVDFRNLLEDHPVEDVHNPTRRKLNGIVHRIVNHHLQSDEHTTQIGQCISKIDTAFNEMERTMHNIKQELDVSIEQHYPEMFAKSTRWFNDESIYDTNEYILNRRMSIDSVDEEVLLGRMLRYTDWRLPGLCFRPGLEKWVEHLVPLDPLYLVDYNNDLLTPAVEKFHPQYQRRLRTYTVDDRNGNTQILHELPNNQFGYVFAYNWFNFKPIEVINQYFKELWQKMRPGGVMLMTYNDCNFAHGVALAERSFMCFTPGNTIIQKAENAGFELTERYRGKTDVAWLEFVKPGKIYSLRGGQTLAAVIDK